MKTANPLTERQIIRRLQQLGSAVRRDPQKAANGRAAYLQQVQLAAKAQSAKSSVSPAAPVRLIEDGTSSKPRNPLQKTFLRKDMKPMWSIITALILAFTLALGGAGATVLAAQESLPDSPLYGLKTLTEEVRLQLASQTETQLALTLGYAERRVSELAALTGRGEPVPGPVAERLEAHLTQALQLAAGMSADEITPALEKVNNNFQQQLQQMSRLSESHPNEGALLQAKNRLQNRLQLVENGLNDPQGFQVQVREMIQNEIHTETKTQQKNQVQEKNLEPEQNQGQVQDQTQHENQNMLQIQIQQQNQQQTQSQNQVVEPVLESGTVNGGGPAYGGPHPTPTPGPHGFFPWLQPGYNAPSSGSGGSGGGGNGPGGH